MTIFDESRERAEQTGDEWIFGSIPVDLAKVPLTERTSNLSVGVLQYNNVTDSFGCASRAPLNVLEMKLTYFYTHEMHPAIKKWLDDNGYVINGRIVLCDAYIEILNGTTRSGSSLKSPLDAIRKYGVIPVHLIPFENNMTWEEYMDPERVTQKHKDLGAQFLRRLPINYEKVSIEQFPEAIHEDSLVVALYAWSIPVDGIYPPIEGAFNHAIMRYTNEIDVFDGYNPFMKRLDPTYHFFEWGYSLYIPNQNPFPDETLALFEVLQHFGLLRFFAVAWERLNRS